MNLPNYLNFSRDFDYVYISDEHGKIIFKVKDNNETPDAFWNTLVNQYNFGECDE